MSKTLFEKLYYTERNSNNSKKSVIALLVLVLLVSYMVIIAQGKTISNMNKQKEILLNSQEIIQQQCDNEILNYQNELLIAQDNMDTLTAILDNEISVLKESIDNLHSELLKTFYMPNIPLDLEQQQFIHLQCNIYDVDYYLMLALIGLESNYNPKAINYSNSNGTIDKGLAQINSCNYKTLDNHFGRQLDYLDFYDNVEAGVYYYSTIQTDNIYESLLNYNRGEFGAKVYYNKYLTYQSDYVKIVLRKLKEIKSSIEEEK
jgi:hypothetical protein